MNYHLWGDWDSLTEWVRKVELAKKEGLLSGYVIDKYTIVVPSLFPIQLDIVADWNTDEDRPYDLFISDIVINDNIDIYDVEKFLEKTTISSGIEAFGIDKIDLRWSKVHKEKLFGFTRAMIETAISLMNYKK